jgi:glucosyl-3-phosphoglycerate synthase
VPVTNILSAPTPRAARSFALDMDVAVIAPNAHDQLVVIAGTAGRHVSADGASRLDPDELRDRFGPVLGLGDELWRALSTVSADIVCVSSDQRLQPAQINRLTQPLFEDSRLMLVSGVDDPLPLGQGSPRRGDRLAELVARPLVARYEPALVGLRRPLLSSFAARRSLLQAVPFPVGAGIRLSLLIDAIRGYGQEAVAEVALTAALPDDQPLRELGAEAAELIVALHRRSATTAPIADERLAQPWNDLSRVVLATEERPALERILAGEVACWNAS